MDDSEEGGVDTRDEMGLIDCVLLPILNKN